MIWRQSALLGKTFREAPKDEVSKNARLLIQAGFIHKEAAGVYNWLPLGRLVLERLTQLIRRELTASGAVEMALSALQPSANWQASGRWDLPVWYKLANAKSDLGLAWTHEEPLTALLRDFVSSYQDLPLAAHQFQTKFRHEERAKSGLLRGREFLMNDLYYFTSEEPDLDRFYKVIIAAYRRIFEQIGLGDRTFLTIANGGEFSPWSHEFQTLTAAGEDTIYLDRNQLLAINKEVYNQKTLAEWNLRSEELEAHKTIEVANIFKLGTRFSTALGLNYRSSDGVSRPVLMGSFGIGVSRLVGTLVEVLGGEKTMLWPAPVAPALAHLIVLEPRRPAVRAAANTLLKQLENAGSDVLYDERDLNAGEKFADADLIGLPHRFVLSPRQVEAAQIEWQNRLAGETSKIPIGAVLEKLRTCHV